MNMIKSNDMEENQAGIDAVVVTGIDYRFIANTLKFVKSQKIKDFDWIAVAGSCRQHNTVKKQLFSSFTLHHPKKVILMQHEDDGAYGGSKAFKNQVAEFEAYKNDLYRLSGWINKRIGNKDFDIKRYIIKLDGDTIEL